MSYEDEDYFLPLEDKRVFGAGIQKKRVRFVPSAEKLSTTGDVSTTAQAHHTSEPAASVADRYLSIVLPKEAKARATTEAGERRPEEDSARASAPPSLSAPPQDLPSTGPDSDSDTTERCEICNLPLAPTTPTTSMSPSGKKRVLPHEASLAHQVCLTHSHPPSHLDRTRHGLRYLASFGWDPDSRLGLGAPGREGIREPIKGRVKNDTVGLGVQIEPSKAKAAVKGGKIQKLNAKEVRQMEAGAKKKRERLQEMFYRNDDIERYLGGGGGGGRL